jgi:hypothetical protein
MSNIKQKMNIFQQKAQEFSSLKIQVIGEASTFIKSVEEKKIETKEG